MNNALHRPQRVPSCPGGVLSRREFLKCSAAALAGSALLPDAVLRAADSNDQPVRRALTSIRLCKRYEYAQVKRAMGQLLRDLEDVTRLVKKKHVTVKINLVNTSEEEVTGVPLWLTVTVHPAVARALGSLLVEYGARSVTFCDQLPFQALDEQAFAGYDFKLAEFNQVMRGRARFENTRNRGPHKDYAIVKVPGGELATAWEVNRAYVDTDVLVSLTKLKSHVSAGITGGMKNLFGVPPSSLYGDDLDKEPDERSVGYRNGTMHNCNRKPLTSVSMFTGKSVEGDHGYNGTSIRF